MSLVLARAGPLKPELRLAKAISEFEMMLSLEQKADFQKHTQLPDASDVVRLTAEIDRASTAKANERRRCYGPRVTNFLEGLHQFAGTVDIAVGGAIQNRMASGVWAVVRFSLLALTKYSPYIDKLSKILMEIGQAAPALKEMTKLYSNSQRLQDALSEYYVIVVELCREIYTICKASTIGQLWTAFAEESYKQRLKQWSHAIQTEMSLETAKLVKAETKQSQAFRWTSNKHMELQKRQQQQQFKQQILDACSKHKYQTIWKQTRKLGNTTSFLKDAAYQEWLSAKTSCTLLYSGKLGSGKSVLLANAVDDLHLRDEFVTSTAYFFCRHDVSESLQARTIVGCLARQLLQYATNLESLVKKAETDNISTEFDTEDLLKLVKVVVTKPVYFVVDGVDELEQNQRNMLLDHISKLQEQLPLLVCFSTRSPHDFLRGSKFTEPVLQARISQHNPDIELYISDEIDHCVATESLVVSDDNLVQEIKERLSTKVQGMFLWVYLQIVDICSMASDFEIRRALDDLPEDLAATYSRLLQNLKSAKSPYPSRLLELLLVAYRPLHYDEVCEALSFDIGEITLDPSKILNNIDGILRSCNGLVLVDEEELTVRLVHFSANQFLISPQCEPRFEKAIAQQKMFGIIMTYLNSSMLETRMTRRKTQAIDIAAVPAALLNSTMPRISKLVLRRRNNHNGQVMVGANGGDIAAGDPRFKDYALECWSKHFSAVDQINEGLDLFDLAIANGRIDLDTKDNRQTLIEEAVTLRHCNCLKRLFNYYTTYEQWLSAIHRAGHFHDMDSIDFLVRLHRDHVSLIRDSILDINLFIVKSMLRVCTPGFLNKTYQELDFMTPLVFAIRPEGAAIFQEILSSDKVDSSQTRSLTRYNLFFWAIQYGTVEIMEIVLSHASFHVQHSNTEIWQFIFSSSRQRLRKPISWEKHEGEIVRLLLKEGYIGFKLGEVVGLEYTAKAPHLRILPLAKAVSVNNVSVVKAILEFDRTQAIFCCCYQDVGNGQLEGPLGKRTAIDFARDDSMRALLLSYSTLAF